MDKDRNELLFEGEALRVSLDRENRELVFESLRQPESQRLDGLQQEVELRIEIGPIRYRIDFLDQLVQDAKARLS